MKLVLNKEDFMDEFLNYQFNKSNSDNFRNRKPYCKEIIY